ncbi:MAG: phosphotransferase, partial [Pseudomonadales bacterium]|nr:phosphotransferase [Pseudomonadales bacterium]
MNPINDNTAERLRDCIATWESWDAGLTSTPLPVWQYGGFSNETFLVTDNHKRLVLRLNGEAKHFGVDRELEAKILSGLANQPWVPALIHRDRHLDFQVMEYIHGTNLIVTDLAGHLSAVGRLFTEIHQIEMDIDTRLNPIDQ